MAFSPNAEVKILEILFPTLQRFLNVEEVKPFLVQNGVISLQQCEELQLGTQISTSSKLAEKTILMVARHQRCASQLLKALEATQSASISDSSHHQIIKELKHQLGHLQPVSTVKDGFQNDPEDLHHVIPGASNEPLPLLNYKFLKGNDGPEEKLRVQLAVESRHMLEEFTSFCVHVGDMLQNRGVTTDRVRTVLQYRLGSKNIGETSMKRVTEATTIHSLLCTVEPFVSWFNYDLIALLAKELGGEEGSELVAVYESKFQQYLQRLIFECPPFSSIKSIPSQFEELAVKLDWNFEQVTIQDITIFKAKLCELLGKNNPSVFILKSVEEGCVLLTWLVPESIVDYIMACLERDAEALLKWYPNIVYLRLGPKLLDPQCSRYVESRLSSRPSKLVTLHETENERVNDTDSKPSQEHKLQVGSRHGSLKGPSPLVSPTLTFDESPTISSKGEVLSHPLQKVQLRNKKSPRPKMEYRKSSGYYSPVASMCDSLSHSQRSSLVLDSSGRASARSSGYYSPSERLSVHFDEEGENDQKPSHAELQKTRSSDAPWTGPVNERSNSPLITSQKTHTHTHQRSFESYQN